MNKLSLLRGALPCWIRMVLALFAACWIGFGAAHAGAAEEAPAAAAAEAAEAAEAHKPIDRAFVVQVVGEPKGVALTGDALEKRTHEVALLLRCPVCQGSSVADSPSSTAVNMKNEVRDLIAQGFDQDQVLRYFEASYGQFVLMEPKAEGFNLLVWIGPGVLLLAGLGVVLATVRKLGRKPVGDVAAAARVPSRGELPDDEELSRYVRKVRELAYGWPRGEPPAAIKGDA